MAPVSLGIAEYGPKDPNSTLGLSIKLFDNMEGRRVVEGVSI